MRTDGANKATQSDGENEREREGELESASNSLSEQ